MALSAASRDEIKAARKRLREEINVLQQKRQSHQQAIQAIDTELTEKQARLNALTADLPEVSD